MIPSNMTARRQRFLFNCGTAIQPAATLRHEKSGPPRGALMIVPKRAVSWMLALFALATTLALTFAEQFVLFDVTFTYTKEDADNSKPSKSHYYLKGDKLNPARPRDWTSPVDYRNGTVHIRAEVLEKPPGGEPTTWTICYIPNRGQGNGYGCTGTDLYREKGVYEKDVPMTAFWQNDAIVWSEGIKQMDLVIKDGSGGSGHAHKRADAERFFPTKMRITVVQVSAGSKYDRALAPGLSSNAADVAQSTANASNNTAESAQPKPTVANVPYGSHERQVLDFWKAESAGPTPLIFHIHGGGWVAGDKARVANLDQYLSNGISVVSINYRYVTQAMIAEVSPPVQWPLHDAARALQFVRSKAAEWNIDKNRIGATGGSAGACSSLWLAFHNDMADPNSTDPIARESTRLWCAAVTGAQTSLDPQQLKEWTPNSRYGGHAFGFMPDPLDTKTRDTQFSQFLAAREAVLAWIKEYSPYEHVTADDPEVYLYYTAPPALGKEQKDPTHTANFGVKLQEKLRAARVHNELVYPGAPRVKHATVADYLIAKLKSEQR